MPTAITGQNGAVVKQATKIAVTGCPKKAKAKKRGTSGKRVKKHRRVDESSPQRTRTRDARERRHLADGLRSPWGRR